MESALGRLGVALGVSLGLLVAAPAPAGAATVSAPRVAVQELVGERDDDLAGASVAPAGDINGDGRDDVIVGAPLAGPAGRADAGSAYVVFGGGARGRLQLGALAARGFRIDGAVPLPRGMWHVGAGALTSGAGAVVAGLGDGDGDGLDDVAISGREPGPFGGTATVVFVVFGSQRTDPVDLGALGCRGFVIRSAGDFTVIDGHAAGDVNGDGRADVAVRTAVDGDEDAGSVAVVLGRPGSAAVAVGVTGAEGTLRISGGLSGMQLGQAVAPAGDVNRDGYGDLLLGAPGVAGGRGAVIVLYGTPLAADVRIRPGERFGGRLVRAPSGRKGFGYAVARLGGGFIDGAPAPPLRGLHGRGGAWILPSRTAHAIWIEGPRTGGPAGTAVSATEDGSRALVLTRGRSLRPARALLYSRRGRRPPGTQERARGAHRGRRDRRSHRRRSRRPDPGLAGERTRVRDRRRTLTRGGDRVTSARSTRVPAPPRRKPRHPPCSDRATGGDGRSATCPPRGNLLRMR